MAREQTIHILYDMALASGGETRVRPLITKTLQRLLYHTTFPCGLFISGTGQLDPARPNSPVHLELVIGCHHLLPLTGQQVMLPTALLHGPSALLEEDPLLEALPQLSFACRSLLRLRVSADECFLLLSPRQALHTLPLSTLFEPILRNFGKNLQLCRENEAYTESLQAENQRRKAAEKMLRQERDLFAAGPVVVFRWASEPSLPIEYVSDNIHAQFGYRAQELCRQRLPFSRQVHPEDLAPLQALIADSSQPQRDFFESEYRIADRQGQWRWIYDLTIPQRNPHGELESLTGYIIDISQRKQAELEQRLLASVFEANEAIAITDAGNRFVRVNQAFCAITGYHEDEVIGRQPSLLRSGNHDTTFYRQMWQQVQQQGHWEGEIINRRKDGELYPEWLSITAVADAQGQIGNYIAHFTDLSTLKAQQRRIERTATEEQVMTGLLQLALAETDQAAFLDTALELLFGQLPWLSEPARGAVFLVDTDDPDYLSLTASRHFEPAQLQHCQHISIGECRCGLVALQPPPLNHHELHTCQASQLLNLQAHCHYTVPILQQQRVLGILNVLLAADHPASEDEQSFLLRVADVLSLGIGKRQTQQLLLRAKEEAEQANRAKSDFLSRMSHELRTPLNAILGFAQILEYDAALQGEQRDSVQEIIKAGHHLLQLINEVLDLARIEAGGIDLQPEPLQPAALLDECIALLRPLAAARGIALHNQARLGVWVHADRMRLKQVLLNLLSNAIKYNRQHGQVQLLDECLDEGRWCLQVRDSGQGIDAAQLDELFQPFKRLAAEHSGIEGTGIGLSITQRLVELMAGEIGVESHPGQGSTFRICLPRLPPPAADRQ